MTPEFLLLSLVVITALAFDFTNGFHDTANAMATSIATRALSPKTAVTLSAILNLVGAFLSVEVAITVTNAVIRIQNPDGTPKPELLADGGQALLLILLSGLAGAIIWNILTWLWGLPSSSSHALFGGLVGATVAGLGWNGVKWVGEGTKLDGVIGKVVLPALLSPAIALVVAATFLMLRRRRGLFVWLIPGAFIGVGLAILADVVLDTRSYRIAETEESIAAEGLANLFALIIMDEATASVDPFTEVQIQEGLETLMADRTAIVIAHRLSTVRNADRIVVLENGMKVEEGKHKDLLSKNGVYANIYRSQVKTLAEPQ